MTVSSSQPGRIITLLSTDAKPEVDEIGSKLIETDTGNKYEYRGLTIGWVIIDNAGSRKSELSNNSIWSYGTWPEDRYDPSSAQAGDALDNTIFGELTNHDLYKGVIFYNTAGNVTVQITLDGVNWIAADHPFIDLGVVARTIVTGTSTNVGPFLMNTPCRGFRFLNEGAVQASVIYAQIGRSDV